VLSGFMRILTSIFTDNIQSINLHPSLLPLYKGAQAIEKSFQGDEETAGVSVHYVTSELDSGEIILQESFEKKNFETYEKFYSKIKELEYEALPKAILIALRK
jgi:phosphoribosylglycinamide formyltransferase-1